MFDLTRKTALLTGGTRGLGLAIAQALLQNGANVAITGQSRASVEPVQQQLTATFGTDRVLGLTGDLAEPSTAASFVAEFVATWKRLDILVNNAGINIRRPIEQLAVDEFDKVMAINVRAPWLLCRAVEPLFKSQKSGRVINIASALGVVGLEDRSLYCMSKGAVVQLTRQLAVEWGPMNVTVNAICPGPFETEMNRPLLDQPELYGRFAGFSTLGRWGKMNEIGPAAVFLASDESSFITGNLLFVDGGWTAR